MHIEERAHLYKWVEQEDVYVASKFDDERDGHDATFERYDLDEFWFRQVIQYYDRARQYFIGAKETTNPETRRRLEMLAEQALAKGFATARDCAASAIHVYGPLPTPGVPSGEISEWSSTST